jgi:hypothetical protein
MPNRPKEVIAAEKAAKAARKVEREAKKAAATKAKAERKEARELKKAEKQKAAMKKRIERFDNKFASQLLETQRMVLDSRLTVQREQAMERNLKHQAEAVEAAKQARIEAKIAGQEAQIKADGERYEREQLTRDMEHDQTLDDIEDDEELAPRRSGRSNSRVAYTPAAQARAVAEAKQRGRKRGAALGAKAMASGFDNCMKAYVACMTTNEWELSDVNGVVTAETVRKLLKKLCQMRLRGGYRRAGKKPCATSEEFLTAFFELCTEQGWSMGDPETGEDTDDSEFDNEYRTARYDIIRT